MTEPLALEFYRVTCGYAGQAIFSGVDLTIRAGEFAAVVGPTGCGKTTLLRTALGLLEPMAGTVRVLGVAPRHARGRIGYVPQIELVDWNFPLTVEQVVTMGCYGQLGRWPWAGRRQRQAVSALLERLGIGECREAPLRALSGGQQQRVFLARALVARSPILVLDEPTAGVDLSTQRDILELLGALNRDGITVVLTTHDLNAVAARLPWVVCFNRGVVAAGEPDKILTPEVLGRTYQAEIAVVDTEVGRFMAPTHAPATGRRPAGKPDGASR